MRNFRYGCFVVLLTLPTTLWAQPTFSERLDTDLFTTISSWGASWVDVDGDYMLDLFVSRNGSGGNLLYLNTGTTFERTDAGDLTATNAPGSLGNTWADYDNDGDIDAYIVGGGSGTGAGRLFQNEGGTFTQINASPIAQNDDNRGWTAAWGDYDSDGFVDLVVAHPAEFAGTPNQTNHLFHNEGDGSFTRVTEGPIVTGEDPYTVPSWSDYDLDGDIDLFIGSGPALGGTAPDNLYENQGDGTFTRIETAPFATQSRDGQVMNWIDFDNDGDLDLYVTNFSGTARNDFYRNDDGTYVEITEGPIVEDTGGSHLANTWGDLDNDGDLDAFITTGGAAADRLYSNNGDGTFTRVESDPLTVSTRATSGATLGDYDNDGDLDLVVTSQAQSGAVTRLYENTTESENGWLKLDLVGTTSNRSAIGAKVRATATIGGSEVTQFREVSAQNTFNGQNALTVHFGLGDAASADLEITWPSGTIETYDGITPNKFLEITEEEGFVAVSNESDAVSPDGTLALGAAYPNPFAVMTTIDYTVPAGSARLELYDLLGRWVRTLADGAHAPGIHRAEWDGTDAAGRVLSSGLYILRLESNGQTVSRRLSLVH